MAAFTTSDDITIAYDMSGEGPPVLLVHGFPESRAMWDPIVPALEDRFTLITADLRGYGASSKPAGAPDLYTFRAMGGDLQELMTGLGFERFHLVGHDRGARVAYRMALDAADRIRSLTLMDIVPTDFLVETFTYDVSKAYYHWSFLAQPAPLPERLISADPDLFFETCLLGWGGAQLRQFPALESYRAVWRTPEAIAAMANDYRAGVTLDVTHDRADRGRMVRCPTLVLYGAEGVMGRLYDIGDVWADRLSDMRAEAVPGGHFFPEQSPGETLAALRDFLTGQV